MAKLGEGLRRLKKSVPAVVLAGALVAGCEVAGSPPTVPKGASVCTLESQQQTGSLAQRFGCEGGIAVIVFAASSTIEVKQNNKKVAGGDILFGDSSETYPVPNTHPQLTVTVAGINPVSRGAFADPAEFASVVYETAA